MKTSTRFCLGVSTAALLASACGASAPTTELMTARNVYSQARSSEAAQLNPRGVHEAHKALAVAEAAHEDDPGSASERHYAYIATRKSELAIAQASEALARKEQQRADADYRAGLEQQSEVASRQSSQYAEQLTQTQAQLQENTAELEARERKLTELQAASDRAQAELRQMESMREEAGKLVISLSGVLFQAGGNELSSTARGRLDTVAQALAAYSDRNIVVEGHTDSSGSDSTNQQLSQKRADAVRQYLESRGVQAARMRSIGRGESEPVASNDTPDGRANNRRVEVIVEPAAPGNRQSAAPAPASPSTNQVDRQNVSGVDSEPSTSERTPSK